MITIAIKEFSTWISVRIFDGGESPRVRTASSLSHFRAIMREELAHFSHCGLETSIQRENAGKFRSLRWSDIPSIS